MLRRLRCSAAGNEDRQVFSIRGVRPKQMIIRATSLRVLPEPPIFFQIIDRWRIGIAVVEVADFVGYVK
jgi:uncharacterized membrane protein